MFVQTLWTCLNLFSGFLFFAPSPGERRDTGDKDGSYGSLYVSEKLPTYPSPKPTLTLTLTPRERFWLGGGVGGQFPRNLVVESVSRLLAVSLPRQVASPLGVRRGVG